MNKEKRAQDLKIAYIGGGSRGWAWGLMSDLAQADDISGEVRLYDIDKQAAYNNEIIGNKIKGGKSEWKYVAKDTIGEALTGADFVVISILPGTFDEMESDVHLPEKYGIYQAVGDTSGPGGIVRALRTIPMYEEIALAIKEYSPDAWVINYTNPITKKHTQGELIIKNVEMKRSFEFKIGDFTLEKHDFDEEFTAGKLGDWCKIYGNDFSGEVIYKVEFDFDKIPESIEIDLGCVKYSCDVTLNDVLLTTMCFAPFVCTAERQILKQHNTLLIRVANTPANQYVAATFFDEIPQNIIGPYHKIAKQFEGESLESGLLSNIKISW